MIGVCKIAQPFERGARRVFSLLSRAAMEKRVASYDNLPSRLLQKREEQAYASSHIYFAVSVRAAAPLRRARLVEYVRLNPCPVLYVDDVVLPRACLRISYRHDLTLISAARLPQCRQLLRPPTRPRCVRAVSRLRL